MTACRHAMYEARFLTTDNFIIAEFPTVIEEILTLDNCCRVPMTRNSVFSSLSKEFITTNHAITYAKKFKRESPEVGSKHPGLKTEPTLQVVILQTCCQCTSQVSFLSVITSIVNLIIIIIVD